MTNETATNQANETALGELTITREYDAPARWSSGR